MTTTTPLPMDQSPNEQYFIEQLCPYAEGDDLLAEACALAGAEQLAFMAGAIFIWEPSWEVGINEETLTMKIPGRDPESKTFPGWMFNDDLRRVHEAAMAKDAVAELVTAIEEQEN